MTKMWKALLFGLLLSALSGAEAQTITAKSCNQSDVQTALSSVTSTTTTVSIPAGTCSWTSLVNFTVPSGSSSLSIIGAGNLSTLGGGDATVIVDNDTTDVNSLFYITTAAASSYFRLAGLTFESGAGTTKQNGMLNIAGNSQNVRVDHMHVNLTTGVGFSGEAIRFDGWNYGVVDHSLFDGVDSGQNGLEFWETTYGGGSNSNGDGAFAASTSFGSSSFIFVENNTFNNLLTANDCAQGGKWVWRFNTVNATSIQTHPTGSQGRGRGCRAMEVYENTFTQSNSTPSFNVFFMSSGTGLIWGNTAATGYETFITLHSMRRDNTTYTQTTCSGTNCSNGWGYCGTSFNGTGSTWDQNTSTSTGYTCLDQPGRGIGDLLAGAFPNTCDVTAGKCTSAMYTGSWPNQASEPVYEWSDQWVAAPGYPYGMVNNYNPDVLIQNKDYYTWCNPSSPSGCTSFNGTVGVGSGTLATRPTTCTTGVAYWATDQGSWNTSGSGGQGELFKCTATNTWTLFYTPYTYPHPLDTSGPAPGIPVNPQAVVQTSTSSQTTTKTTTTTQTPNKTTTQQTTQPANKQTTQPPAPTTPK